MTFTPTYAQTIASLLASNAIYNETLMVSDHGLISTIQVYTAFNSSAQQYQNQFTDNVVMPLFDLLDRQNVIVGMSVKQFVWTSTSNVVELSTSQEAKTQVPNLQVYYSHLQVAAIYQGSNIQYCEGHQRYDTTTRQCVSACGATLY